MIWVWTPANWYLLVCGLSGTAVCCCYIFFKWKVIEHLVESCGRHLPSDPKADFSPLSLSLSPLSLSLSSLSPLLSLLSFSLSLSLSLSSPLILSLSSLSSLSLSLSFNMWVFTLGIYKIWAVLEWSVRLLCLAKARTLCIRNGHSYVIIVIHIFA